ncbi:aryl-sulfate sulfotransferase [bacterium]|nr:aryl-sulfate sulfotransferase [bacterium]
MIRKLFMLFLFFAQISLSNTVGMISWNQAKAWNGYTFFAPNMGKTGYLVDMLGRIVHQWGLNAPPGHVVYLLPGGDLMATGVISTPYFHEGGKGGLIQRMDWNGNVLWTFQYTNNAVCQHHDIEVLPDGHVLAIAWELKTKTEATQAGRNPEYLPKEALWADHLIEVDETGTIVWEWHIWDHLIQDYSPFRPNYGPVGLHPELVDLNYVTGGGQTDWTHVNCVDYNADLDQILISVHEFCEIWVIEHSETSEIAAGHTGGRYGKGGDILYRWGNPRTWRAGTQGDQKLFQQHHAHWIDSGLDGEGNILIFNNGWYRKPYEYASVDEIRPPLLGDGTYALEPGAAYGPDALTWTYSGNPSESLRSNYISGAERLPNGNTLVCAGAIGRFIETTPSGETVWEYVNPVTDKGILKQGESPFGRGGRTNNPVFRCTRFASDSPEIAGRTLVPGNTVEIYTTPVIVPEPQVPGSPVLYANYPNPFNPDTRIRYTVPHDDRVRLTVVNAEGQTVAILADGHQPAGDYTVRFDGSRLNSGVYVCILETGGRIVSRRMMLMK